MIYGDTSFLEQVLYLHSFRQWGEGQRFFLSLRGHLKNNQSWDFPGGAMQGGMQGSQCKGAEFDPCSGN